MATTFWLLLLRGPSSARMYGVGIETYDRHTTPVLIAALIAGMFLCALGFMSWRDLHKKTAVEKRSWHQWALLGCLIFTLVSWLFLLTMLCVPSIFNEIINS
jgi:hypothetical protein